jgi:uncharacterized protein YkwD
VKRYALLALLCACVCALALLRHPQAARANGPVAVNAVSYAALEQDLLGEINLARARPAEYASYLEGLRPMFAGKEYRRPGRPALVTEEGAAALEEAIKFMRAARPAGPLSVAAGMCSGARELVKEQGASGATGHKGADGGYCEQRAQRFGAWKEPIGENLSYGDDTARERVLTLLIDDGVANRGHRQRIMDPAYRVAGVACGEHKLGSMCVITLAGGFTDSPSAAQGQPSRNSGAPAPPAGAKRF